MEQRERATWDQALSEAVMWVVGDGALDRGLICREAMGSEGREMVESLLQGKPKNTGVGSPSLLQGIFLTQESNWCLLHCRVLYPLSHLGSPGFGSRQKATSKGTACYGSSHPYSAIRMASPR